MGDEPEQPASAMAAEADAHAKLRPIIWPPVLAGLWLLAPLYFMQNMQHFDWGFAAMLIWIPTVPVLAAPLFITSLWMQSRDNTRPERLPGRERRIVWYVVTVVYMALSIPALLIIAKG